MTLDLGALARELRRAHPLNDPRELAGALGMLSDRKSWQKQASGVTVRCPAHGGVSLSLTRGPDDTVRARCFGCDFTGDALTVIAGARGLDAHRDFRELLEVGAELAGRWDLVDMLRGAAAPRAPRPAPPRPTRAPDPLALDPGKYSAIVEALLELCPLRRSPLVTSYLEQRAIFAHAEAAGVRGLPNDTTEIAAALLERFDRADLEGASVLRKGLDAIDVRYPVLIPWRDRAGAVSCLQRRAIVERKPKYLSPAGRSPSAPFGAELLEDALAFDPDAEVIVCEGALDTIARRRISGARSERAAVIGLYNASAGGVTGWADLVRGRRVVLALDADDSGNRAAEVLAAELQDVARELVRERPVGAKDWNEALTRTG